MNTTFIDAKNELKDLREKRDRLKNDARVMNKTGMSRSEEREWNRLMEQVDVANEQITRLEKIPDTRTAGSHDNPNGGAAEERSEQREVFRTDRLYGSQSRERFETEPEFRSFRKWMAGGLSVMSPDEQEMLKFNSFGAEERALSAVTGAAGAYSIPQGFQY